MYCKYKAFVLTQRKRSYTTDSSLFVFHSTGMGSFAIKVKLPPLVNKLKCACFDVDLYKFTFLFRQRMKRKVSDNHYEDKKTADWRGLLFLIHCSADRAAAFTLQR